MIITAIGIIKDWRDLNALEIVRHPWFISAFAAGSLAQLFKLLSNWKKTRQLDFSHLFMSGGMPSAHSALVTALSVAVGLTDGFNSPIAMIAVGFATITIADAVSLRRAAGEQAKLLNRIVERLNKSAPFEAERLQERLGHKRREVLGGILFGIAVAVSVCGIWDFWK
ncbi:MAG: divergent PAP2 family protein [Kiritimatiellae bacterium]|nr:divergent PAP2 family protein [Kiritimatiellia bacterium]